MKLCNETITVFNKRYDDDMGDDMLIPTVIEGVSWFGTAAEIVDPERGLKEASKIIIRIPADAKAAGGKAYADPLAWKDAPDVSGLWTLQGGDIIVKGTVEGTDPKANAMYSITPSSYLVEEDGAPIVTETGAYILSAPWTPPWTQKRLAETFADICKVLAVTDNRRAPNGKHFKVVGT